MNFKDYLTLIICLLCIVTPSFGVELIDATYDTGQTSDLSDDTIQFIFSEPLDDFGESRNYHMRYDKDNDGFFEGEIEPVPLQITTYAGTTVSLTSQLTLSDFDDAISPQLKVTVNNGYGLSPAIDESNNSLTIPIPSRNTEIESVIYRINDTDISTIDVINDQIKLSLAQSIIDSNTPGQVIVRPKDPLLSPITYDVTDYQNNEMSLLVTASEGHVEFYYPVLVEANPNLVDNILINDGTINCNFSPYVYNYTFNLPYGTTALPKVEASVPGTSSATIETRTSGSLLDTYTVFIDFYSEASELLDTYTLTFTVEPPPAPVEYVTLNTLTHNKGAIEAFNHDDWLTLEFDKKLDSIGTPTTYTIGLDLDMNQEADVIFDPSTYDVSQTSDTSVTIIFNDVDTSSFDTASSLQWILRINQTTDLVPNAENDNKEVTDFDKWSINSEDAGNSKPTNNKESSTSEAQVTTAPSNESDNKEETPPPKAEVSNSNTSKSTNKKESSHSIDIGDTSYTQDYTNTSIADTITTATTIENAHLEANKLISNMRIVDDGVDFAEELITATSQLYDETDEALKDNPLATLNLVDLANNSLSNNGRISTNWKDVEIEDGRVYFEISNQQLLKTALEINRDKATIETLLEGAIETELENSLTTTIEVEMPISLNNSKKSGYRLSQEAIDIIVENNIDQMNLSMNGIKFKMSHNFFEAQPNTTFDFEATKENSITTNDSDKLPSHVTSIGSPVFSLTAKQNNIINEAFDHPLQLEIDLNAFGYTPNKKDIETLVIGRLNDSTNRWEIVGGRYDEATNSLTVYRGHLSKYTILKSDQNISHIDDQWAKTEIAALTNKGIIEKDILSENSPIEKEEFTNWIANAYGIDNDTLKEEMLTMDENSKHYSALKDIYEYSSLEATETEYLSKAEMALMITSAMEEYDHVYDTNTVELAQYETDLPEWAIDPIETVIENDIADATYFGQSDNLVTNAEAASILNQVYN